MKNYVADFETIVPDMTQENPETRVWAWGVTEIGNTTHFDWGTDIDSFMDWCYYRRKNIIAYFHNLRFDGEFIIYWLLTNGFTYSKEKDPKTFSTLITKMGQFYSIEIIWEKKLIYEKNRKRTFYKKTVFYDSLKKLPFKVEQIAKAFKLPMKKLDIDYKKERPFGYMLNKEEIDYLKNDVQIVSEALFVQFEQNLTKMTVARDALEHFKEGLEGDFENSFPVLPLNIDDHIRDSYRGGFTYVAKRFAGVDMEEGIVLDKNSMYPAVMYNQPLPHGIPVWFDGEYEYDSTYPLFIQEIFCEFKLKPDKIPSIQVKTPRYQENLYLESNVDSLGIAEPVTLFLTNMDLEIFMDHYDVTVHSWNGGYKFRACIGVFQDYIDHWMKVKEENAKEKNALYTLAKLMLNSLYGKFASNPDVTGKYPILNEDGSISYKLPRDENGDEIKDYKDPVYTAMGVFITSWARHDIITSAQKVYPRFIYADTDSLHLMGSEIPEGLEIHHSRLGAWKHEGTFTRARFIRQKTYVEEIDRVLHVTCAGMPDTVKVNVDWANFHVGFSSPGKLVPKHIKGGVVLVDSDFTLKGEKDSKVDMDTLWKEMEKKMCKSAQYDEIKEGIKQHGYIETCKPGDVYYSEYKYLPRSVKMKYFRKNGLPVDVFATEMEMDVNGLFDRLRSV